MEKTVEEISQNRGWSDISVWSIAQKINRLYTFLMSNHKDTLWFYVFLLLAGGVLLHIAYPAPHTTNTHSSESDIDNAVTHDQQYHFSASEEKSSLPEDAFPVSKQYYSAREETNRLNSEIPVRVINLQCVITQQLWVYCFWEDW